MIRVRIAMPDSASKGDSVEIKTLASHPMESGFRYDNNGDAIPRNIIEKFEVRYRGQSAFVTKFGPGIAANPFLSFFLTVEESSEVEFVWTEQGGEITRETRQLKVV